MRKTGVRAHRLPPLHECRESRRLTRQDTKEGGAGRGNRAVESRHEVSGGGRLRWEWDETESIASTEVSDGREMVDSVRVERYVRWLDESA
jgi:hypothetical protein